MYTIKTADRKLFLREDCDDGGHSMVLTTRGGILFTKRREALEVIKLFRNRCKEKLIVIKLTEQEETV